MDPVTNPFAPGAGTQPPELAGREKILTDAQTAIQRARAGHVAKSQMLLGLRGVGKTVLLNRIAHIADERDCRTVMLEAPEEKRLADMLVPPLRQLLFKLSGLEQAKVLAKQALGVLRSFAKAFKVKVGDLEFQVEPALGSADSGSLDSDLPDLFSAVSSAAKGADSALVLLIDEVQYLSQSDLAALIVSTHKMAQLGLPFVLFGAGLPQLAQLAGEAKSYAERLFEYPGVGPLPDADARRAVTEPLTRGHVTISQDALDLIIEKTKGYPYFLQEWGSHAWNVATSSPITLHDTTIATTQALTTLDQSFFRVRLDRLTPQEKDYMRAMAELGPGPHRSGDIAETLGMHVTAAGPLRNRLIRKGMIYSQEFATTSFTVPMFDEFMKRSIPTWTPNPDHGASSKRKRKRPSTAE